MSNDYVIASAQFLKESWYRENAGTPEIQEAKLLDEIFEEIVDYCLECDIELDDSVEIANRIIEEDLINEFYEEFLIEKSVNPTARTNWNQVRSRVGVPPKTNVSALDPNRLLHRSSPTGARLPAGAARPTSGVGGNVARVGVVGGLAAALWGGPLARPTVSGSAEQRAIQKANASRTSQQRARVAAEKANKQAREQLANRNNTQVNRDSVRRNYSPSIRSTSNTVSKSTSMPSAKPFDRGLTTVGGQGVATNTGSLAREPQAPFNPTRPIISSIFKDKNNPLKKEDFEVFFSEQGMMDLNAARRERERIIQSRAQGTSSNRVPPTRPTRPTGPIGRENPFAPIPGTAPTRPTAAPTRPTRPTRPTAAPTRPTGPIGRENPFAPIPGTAPTRPTAAPTRPTRPLWGQGSRTTPTAPSRTTGPKVEPTAPPVPRPTMARLGQDPRDSIFSRGTSMSPQQARSEYENKMRQAIRGGTREIYRLPGNTGMTDLSNAGRG